jgi:hypothetical protein
MSTVFNRFSESVSSTWKLLSDTTNFLSRVKLLGVYEQDLKQMRDQLYRFRKNAEVQRQVRERIVEVRRSLRARGYDLRMGSRDIAVEGFRHDDAMGEGFRRLAIALAEDDALAVAGDLNHMELGRQLDQRLLQARTQRDYSLHFLWYRWRNRVLVLSGSASEPPESFEELKEYVERNKELLLRKLAHL